MTQILKINISNVNWTEALEKVQKWLKYGEKKRYIVTPNPEILVAAQKNQALAKILNDADLALPDGIGLVWASRILGQPLKGRVTGADFMEKLCELAAKEGFTVGLIGGSSGVAVKAAECLKKSYPQLKVVIAQEEWPESDLLRSPASDFHGSRRVLPACRQGRSSFTPIRHPPPVYTGVRAPQSNVAGTFDVPLDGDPFRASLQDEPPRSSPAADHLPIDLLFVAFGVPKQEVWISKNLDNLPVRVAMGVGGVFDYFSGVVPRAPRWMQNLGLEWLYRLIRQPWRIKRQLVLPKFILLVLQEKIFS